jgi:hypothetical protein
VSVNTVNKQVRACLRKLGIANGGQLKDALERLS